MLIKQIHFPKSGPNWGNFALGAIVIIGLITATYIVTNQPKYTPKAKQKDGDVA